MIIMSILRSIVLHPLLLCGVLLLLSAGCAHKRTPPPQASHTKRPPRSPVVDLKAQQRYYDKGLQHYSKENYDEAREAFQQALEAGPNTHLGRKAQENIRKIDQILKTLKEMEKK
jgi:outer membrane protein assembly factor BamD (BamD/ComL family)